MKMKIMFLHDFYLMCNPILILLMKTNIILDNSVSFESGFGRFVPVRPQPRALPLNVQNRENLTNDQHDDVVASSMTGHTLHPYAHQMQNGSFYLI